MGSVHCFTSLISLRFQLCSSRPRALPAHSFGGPGCTEPEDTRELVREPPRLRQWMVDHRSHVAFCRIRAASIFQGSTAASRCRLCRNLRACLGNCNQQPPIPGSGLGRPVAVDQHRINGRRHGLCVYPHGHLYQHEYSLLPSRLPHLRSDSLHRVACLCAWTQSE